MSSFICVVVLSLLSCIQVRRLFSVDLGGESDCPDVVCLTACITVNQSVDLMRLKLVVICLFLETWIRHILYILLLRTALQLISILCIEIRK